MSYLENPPARVPLISQDTYAASGAGLSGVSGGGGGGPVPANITVSSLTVGPNGPGGGQGFINMLSGAGGAVAELDFFLDELNASRVSVSAIDLGDYQNIYGSPNRVVTLVTQNNNVCGDFALGRLVLQDTGTTDNLGYIGVSSTNLYASFSSFTTPPSLNNVSSITGLSSINGQPYLPGGGGGVTSLNGVLGAVELTSSDNSVTITPALSSINLQASGAGSIPSNLNLSTLGIGGTGAGTNPPLNLAVRGGTTVSEIIGFSRPGHTTAAQGILSIYGDDANGQNTLSVVYLSTGTTVTAPINVSNVYADGLVNTSSITGLSSINGQPYVPGGGAVSPNLTLSTLVMNPTGVVSTVTVSGISSITNTDVITIATPDEFHIASLGNVTITTGADFYASRVFISSIDLADAANGYITGVSSINGISYPPPAGSVPANLTLSTLNVSSVVTAKTVVADLVSTGTLQAYSVTANYGVAVNLINTQPGVAIDLYGFYNSLGSGSIPTVTWKNIGYNPGTGATLSTVGLGINGVSSMQMTPANMNITYPGLPASGLCIAGDTPGGTGQSVTSLITSGVVFADNLKDFSCPVIGIKNGDNVSSLTISCVSSITLEGIQLDMTNCNKLVGVTSINGVPWSAISSLIPP